MDHTDINDSALQFCHPDTPVVKMVTAEPEEDNTLHLLHDSLNDICYDSSEDNGDEKDDTMKCAQHSPGEEHKWASDVSNDDRIAEGHVQPTDSKGRTTGCDKEESDTGDGQPGLESPSGDEEEHT